MRQAVRSAQLAPSVVNTARCFARAGTLLEHGWSGKSFHLAAVWFRIVPSHTWPMHTPTTELADALPSVALK